MFGQCKYWLYNIEVREKEKKERKNWGGKEGTQDIVFELVKEGKFVK